MRDNSIRSELGSPGDSKGKGNGGEDLERQIADLAILRTCLELKAGIKDRVAATA